MVDPGADSEEIKEELFETFESKMAKSSVPAEISARIETELRDDYHPDNLTEALPTEVTDDGDD